MGRRQGRPASLPSCAPSQHVLHLPPEPATEPVPKGGGEEERREMKAEKSFGGASRETLERAQPGQGRTFFQSRQLPAGTSSLPGHVRLGPAGSPLGTALRKGNQAEVPGGVKTASSSRKPACSREKDPDAWAAFQASGHQTAAAVSPSSVLPGLRGGVRELERWGKQPGMKTEVSESKGEVLGSWKSSRGVPWSRGLREISI